MNVKDEEFLRTMYDDCQRYMNYHVMLTMDDGRMTDGIIEDVKSDRIIVLVGEDVLEREEGEERQFYLYGRPRRRFRRFRRREFPLASLAALTLLPYIIPPPYPYYYPYPYAYPYF